jgi:hypothetical protein
MKSFSSREKDSHRQFAAGASRRLAGLMRVDRRIDADFDNAVSSCKTERNVEKVPRACLNTTGSRLMGFREFLTAWLVFATSLRRTWPTGRPARAGHQSLPFPLRLL